jgi:hypothetical protein
MRPGPDAALLEFFVETAEAVLEPGAADRDLEIFQAEPEQLFVGEGGPGKFPTRHGAF